MIKLLSLLGGISLAARLVYIKTEDATKTRRFYWNDNQSEVTQMTMSQAGGPGTNNPVSSGKILTIDLGTRKPTDTSFRIPYSDGFVTWGSNTNVYGFNKTAFQLKYDDLNNIKITDYDQDFKNNIVVYYHQKDNEFLARIEMWFLIGQTWYYEKGHYYLQILGEQFINVENSFSNGYIHTSYGKYIILY